MEEPALSLIEQAFDALSQRTGFVERPDQRQLALLISDCLESDSTGAFEAPTGLGKSLAALVPAIAHAIASGKRTVIATYTNVLAEQYLRNDLPLALSLFPDQEVLSQFLIGRQRYACRLEIKTSAPELMGTFVPYAEEGIESEFRRLVRKPQRELVQLWQKIAAPSICPARLCPSFHECFYYKARRKAEKAHIVITNHSVVLMDGILAHASGNELSMLGDYDMLLVDEAHDFAQAAGNALEFELNEDTLGMLMGIATKIEEAVLPSAAKAGGAETWRKLCDGFRQTLGRTQVNLKHYGLSMRPGILVAAPTEVENHPQVKSHTSPQGLERAEELASEASIQAMDFIKGVDRLMKQWKHAGELSKEESDDLNDSLRNYKMVLSEFSIGCLSLFTPEGVSVSYSNTGDRGALLRHDIIDLAPVLKELIWEARPWVCLSATLALDGNLEFFKRQTGAVPDFEEVLPSPFDYSTQAAVYVPPPDTIPDPANARKTGTEETYYKSLAAELSKIIRTLGGRTLALFHSRKEMEGVYAYMDVPPDYPIFLQRRSGVAMVGEKFQSNVHSSLFALRSFWTGFDAPGDTLSCVALVRVPFEVPVDPPQIARMAWLQTRQMDPFATHTLPMAKMMMRQGAGRLIRRAEDRGVIALLDPRLITKRYGEEIIANLPEGMRLYRDFEDAAIGVGLVE
jgi:ATP-dependent DNA helicase DinG